MDSKALRVFVALLTFVLLVSCAPPAALPRENASALQPPGRAIDPDGVQTSTQPREESAVQPGAQTISQSSRDAVASPTGAPLEAGAIQPTISPTTQPAAWSGQSVRTEESTKAYAKESFKSDAAYPKAQRAEQPAVRAYTSNGAVGSLARQITKHATDESEKARAIYDWIAHNIAYDIKSYRRGVYPDPRAETVLSTRLAVCEGYSRLFVAMASEVGLEAVVVSGYSKGFSPGDEKPDMDKPNHAWNAIKLNGKWRLVDVTWGAGHVEGGETFVSKFNPRWFDVAPASFAISHLPVSRKWQLLDIPITAEKFWSAPGQSMKGIDYGLRFESHPGSKINAAGLFQVKISSARPCSLMARLSQGGREVEGNHTLVERQGNSFTISVLPPAAGSYKLLVFVGEPEEMTTESAASYEVVASSGSRQAFPKVYKSFTQQEAYLVSPRLVPAVGSKTTIIIEAPGAYDLMAQADGANIPFAKEGGNRFKAVTTYSGSKLTIFARYDDSDNYKGLLEY